jgi:cytochrome c oxidase cbb3-type subunit 3
LPEFSGYAGLPQSIYWVMIGIIAFNIFIVMFLLNGINRLITIYRGVDALEIIDEAIAIPAEEKVSFIDKINAAVAVEDEESILMDHEYDGIRELDNDLPPWWINGFYLTIVVSVIYLFHYHVFKTGDLQLAELENSLVKAAEEKEAYEKNNAANVTEHSITMLTVPAEIAKGEKVYKQMCAPCHGNEGQGTVGPNLTDEFWLHGGSLKDVFKSIKYGWPNKGMKAWKTDLSPLQIHQITCFIKTLEGSNPPNAKDAQGELYTEAEIITDSLTVE